VCQAADQTVHPRWRQFNGGGDALKGVFSIRQVNRKHVRKFRSAPTTVGERESPAEQQQPASSPIDELPDQILLGGREISRFDRANNNRLVSKKIIGIRWETIREFLWIIDPLAINLILRCAQHRCYLHQLVIVLSAPDELVFPSRLALDVKDALLIRRNIHQPRNAVV